MAVLKTSETSIEIRYEDNSAYITVCGGNYKGQTQIYCVFADFEKFVEKLSELYTTLCEGKAELKEFYEQDFISFESNGAGHFKISGEFNDWGHWNLKFEEVADQTYFKNFINSLKNEIK